MYIYFSLSLSLTGSGITSPGIIGPGITLIELAVEGGEGLFTEDGNIQSGHSRTYCMFAVGPLRRWAELSHLMHALLFSYCPHILRHPPLPLDYPSQYLPKLPLRSSEQRTFSSYFWWKTESEINYTLQSRVIYLFCLFP